MTAQRSRSAPLGATAELSQEPGGIRCARLRTTTILPVVSRITDALHKRDPDKDLAAHAHLLLALRSAMAGLPKHARGERPSIARGFQAMPALY